MDAKTLKKMTVTDLREEAKKIEGATGLSGMKKDELVSLVAGHLGVDLDAPAHGGEAGSASALDKTGIKRRIRVLKVEKREAIAAQDVAKAKACNRQIHDFKRRLRRMARGA